MIDVPQDIRYRLEDHRLLVGKGSFVDDLSIEGQCIGHVIRSEYPHARILDIDVEDAKSLPGVYAVLTGADLQTQGIGDLSGSVGFENRDGSQPFSPPRPILAIDRVRHVGEPVVFIVADSILTALDAADQVMLEYDPLPSSSDPKQALTGTPQIWPGEPNNQCYDWSMGDLKTVKDIFRTAAHQVEVEVANPRMVVCPLEPRCAIAEYDVDNDCFTLYVQTQGVHSVRDVMARVLNVSTDQVRVVTPDVGGSFGMKIFPYPEYVLVLLAAKLTGRPVKWTATRSESFLSDAHGRGRIDTARIAFDREGRMLALHYDAIGDLGAYLSHGAAAVPSIYAATVIGHTYRIPHIFLRSRGVFTNTPPTDAFRGAGKPETIATVEQLMDKSARQLGIDRIELRRKNLVPPEQLPYSMPSGQVIDSGNFEALLDRAVALSDWNNFPQRRNQAHQKGLLQGIGLGMYMHTTGGSISETCEVSFEPSGMVRVLTGSQTGGQGHESTIAALVGATLGIDLSKIKVIQGDTKAHDVGSGTGGSSMLAIVGSTVQRAAAIALANAKNSASELLEVATIDLEYANGQFTVAGTDYRISIGEVAQRCQEQPAMGNCVGRTQFEGNNRTHPSGAYVAEMQCDPNTGVVDIVNLTAVDDVGRILFPKLVDGQLLGAWAQAIGAALMEMARYDEAATGEPMNATFMDYGIPRADDMPPLSLDKLETLSQVNVLGTKGAGEVASLGALGALFNALSDLFGEDSFAAFKTPATPYQTWRNLSQD